MASPSSSPLQPLIDAARLVVVADIAVSLAEQSLERAKQQEQAAYLDMLSNAQQGLRDQITKDQKSVRRSQVGYWASVIAELPLLTLAVAILPAVVAGLILVTTGYVLPAALLGVYVLGKVAQQSFIKDWIWEDVLRNPTRRLESARDKLRDSERTLKGLEEKSRSPEVKSRAIEQLERELEEPRAGLRQRAGAFETQLQEASKNADANEKVAALVAEWKTQAKQARIPERVEKLVSIAKSVIEQTQPGGVLQTPAPPEAPAGPTLQLPSP